MVVKDIESKKQSLRKQRKDECFSIINRGKLWYDTLSYEQLAELKSWYFKWLDVTDTLVIPAKPTWLNDQIEQEEIIVC